MKHVFYALLFLVLTSPAEARGKHQAVSSECNVTMPCDFGNNFLAGIRSINVTMHRERTSGVVPHPTGCPARAFCGCGAAVRVFGAPIRSLWLAANWFKFPRASLAPGTVAVRRHHVFVVEQVLGNGMVMAYDANSGGHATRVHARSVAGYTIVSPRG